MKNTLLCRTTRKSLLYKTGVEYGDYTINHVLGCSHGCLYPCYAFLMAKRFGKVKTYSEWIEPCIVDNALELLENELPKMKNKIRSVHLCFTTDPFMFQHEDIHELSLSIIKKLNQENIKCTVLTKGLLPDELSNLSKNNEYGITLISLNENFRELMEPNASNYKDRIESLYNLHQKGFKTWVSIEPYPTPNIIAQNLLEILKSISFVDRIIFGRTNYNAKISEYKEHQEFYNLQSKQIIDFCISNQKEYLIKKGTMRL